jgi:hypothetical protein
VIANELKRIADVEAAKKLKEAKKTAKKAKKPKGGKEEDKMEI